MERELKLLIDPADIPAFIRHPLLKRHAPDKPHRQRLESRYFDTPDLLFRRHGASLRVRHTEGGGWIQTLKGGGGSSGGLHQRDEWETPVAGPRPDLAALKRKVGRDSPWTGILAARGLSKRLEPLFTTRVERTAWMLRLADGNAAELALDQGGIEHGRLRAPISEVEIELKAGDPARLFDFALALQEALPVRLGNLSKSDRGFALCHPQPPPLAKAGRIILVKGMTVERAMQTIIENCLAQVEGNAEGVARGSDPESVHQMRVGLRRLHSALVLFRDIAPLPPALQEEFKWIGGELGRARDNEVLAKATLPGIIERWPDHAGLRQLQSAMRERAEAARAAAAAAVDSVRYARLMLAFGSWNMGLRWRDSASRKQRNALSSPVRPFADKALHAAHRKLRSKGRGLAGLPPAERHRARVAAKRVRYAAGFFRSLCKPAQLKSYVAALSDLQDILGRLNDAGVAATLLEREAREQPELAGACGFAQGVIAAESERDLRRLEKAWRGFRKKDVPSPRKRMARHLENGHGTDAERTRPDRSRNDMDIILWRHAEAEPKDAGKPDMDRELTAEGMAQAERMADWLRSYLPADAEILVSPARRTVQTADALGRPYTLKAELKPDRDPEDVLAAIGWGGARTVLVVGHQPMLGQLASLLTTGVAADWAMEKAGVWWLGGRGSEPGAVLRAAMDPALYAARLDVSAKG